MPDCVIVSLKSLARIGYWMPKTCAYRLLSEGKPLEPWHPLISGDARSVHRAGISLAGRMVPEGHVHFDDLEDFIVEGLE